MTENEAIKELEWAKNRLMQSSHMDNNRMKAFNMAIQALEKQMAKKPIIIDKQFRDGEVVEVEWQCPICGLNVIEEPPCQEYCQRCGNKLYWPEE